MRILSIVCCLILFTSALMGQVNFEEGKHYEVVSDKKTKEPTVTEFFSLYCGHCFQFEVLMDTIKSSLKAGTKFEKSHVNYLPRNNQEGQEAIVRAFVTMNEMGVADEMIKQFFAAIHLKGVQIDDLADIKQIFIANGISETDFDKVYNSQKVIEEAIFMAKIWEDKKVTTVPTFVVNGKYKIETSSLNDVTELNELINYLLDKD